MSPVSVAQGAHRFTFAVIADTHLNQDEHECNSPFAVNALANARLRFVIHDLNRQDLAFVVHLGDVVHPVPSLGPLYREAADRFREQASILRHPLHLIPGNHDVGDKPLRWGPAESVRQSFLDAWTRHFGAHYFGFVHQDCLFAGINAQVLGSSLPLEAEQRQWLEALLQTHSDRSVYLFTHYPPYLLDQEEPEHYDNLHPSARAWLLELVTRHRVHALFAGHVHHFWYHRYADCHCYLLPSTSFTRQDYSEMFRVASAAQFGRDDAPKLGYVLVHVYERGHKIEMRRCGGLMLAPGAYPSFDLPPVSAPAPPYLPGLLGFDLRQDWCEQVQIPPSGGLDEFDRKWVRNDYGLLALLDLGIRDLRIPLADLRYPDRCDRMRQLTGLGLCWTLSSVGAPAPDICALVQRNAEWLAGWEIACWPDDLGVLADTDVPSVDLPLWFTPLRGKAERGGKQYFHVIQHGFCADDPDLERCLRQVEACGIEFTGLVFHCGAEDAVWQVAEACAAVRSRGWSGCLHLRLGAHSPAEEAVDNRAVSLRVAEAMVVSWALDVVVYCDTLVDQDRGYFPRRGVMDRLFNPRPAYVVMQVLHAWFAALPKPESVRHHADDCGMVLTIDSSAGGQQLVLFRSVTAARKVALLQEVAARSDIWQTLLLSEIGEVTVLSAGVKCSARALEDCLLARVMYSHPSKPSG